MITTTTDTVPGREIVKIIGVVQASKTAWLTDDRARKGALRKLISRAESMGADAIIGIKYTDGIITAGIEGTAVKLK